MIKLVDPEVLDHDFHREHYRLHLGGLPHQCKVLGARPVRHLWQSGSGHHPHLFIVLALLHFSAPLDLLRTRHRHRYFDDKVSGVGLHLIWGW